MMVFLQSCMERGRIREFLGSSRVRGGLMAAAYGLGGFLMAAASVGHSPQPLVLGLLLGAAPGWPVLCLGLGGAAGYLCFWGQAGLPGLAWAALGMLASGALAMGPERRLAPAVLPALAAGLTAVCGLAFVLWRAEPVSVPGYLLRIFLAAGSTAVYTTALDHRDPVCDWLAMGLGVLALAQVAPGSWFCLGYVAAGAIGAAAAFPAAALAGFALDLAQVTRVPMTAVLCAGMLTRLLSGRREWNHRLAPGLVFLPVAALCGVWDLHPLPGLLTGGLLTALVPSASPAGYRRGATGMAQVRLELAAGVLSQTGSVLCEPTDFPVDGKALVSGAVSRSCSSCPCRNGCREQESLQKLGGEILEQPLITAADLPFSCRRSGRVWAQLTRAQEQYRLLLADHARRQEYRQAMVQQYDFLAGYLRNLSDELAGRQDVRRLRYEPRISAETVSRQADNGDRCVWFSGTGGNYYVLLCDGMGTGLAASRESERAVDMLKKLLKAGFPAEYALHSLNSLCILRGTAGAVSIDLAELELETGRGTLYKWGAPPSYLLEKNRTERIGTAVPPPGLSVTEGRGSRERLSLRGGERLVLLSDGAGGEAAMGRVGKPAELSVEALAVRLLEYGRESGADDATAAVVQLIPVATATR